MKQIRSHGSRVRKKYATATYVQTHGVGTRELTAQEIEQFREHVDRLCRGEISRPIRLEAR